MTLQTELDAILAPPADEPETERQAARDVPDGWAPRADYDTTHGGYIVSEPWADGEPEPAEAELLAERSLDPARWMVTSIRYSDWQQSKRTEDGDRDLITLHAKRVNIAPRPAGAHSVRDQDLVQLLRDRRGNTQRAARQAKAHERRSKGAPPAAFVDAGGDYQLGKTDGDGVAGTVDRFMEALHTGERRLEQLRGRYSISTLYLPHLGDCIEGYVSQGGRNRNRTTLSTSEQVDLLIHLLTEQVRHYAPLAERIVVPIIPGNHDEEARDPDGLEHHSWATFAAKQLQRTLRMAGKPYDHVRIVAPPRGELTLTLDMAGVPVTMAHGHKWSPGKALQWLEGQAGGMQLAGEGRVLLSAHAHHLRVEQSSIRTHVQVPALESESGWWRHRKGQQSPPGRVTMLMGEQLGRPLTLPDGHVVRTGWSDLEVA